MFARRQAALAGAPAATPTPARERTPLTPASVLAFLKRPYVAAAAAAVMFIASAGALVFIAADPNAGAPSVRIALRRPVTAQPKPAADAGAQAFTVDTLGMYQDLAAPGFEGVDNSPVTGTATITFPDGGSAAGAKGADPAVRLPPRRAPADPLPAAPMAGVSQPSPQGPMPAIAADGRTAFSAYARPFKADGHPKVALIVGGLGLNPAATKAAIERLPAEITLSFVPYAEGLQGWIDLARANGHEVMLEIPMEPKDYPDNDPGRYTLLSSDSPPEIMRRMDWLMTRATGYFAVTNYFGEKFIASDAGMNTFLGALKSRGVGFIDDGAARRRAGAWARASADAVVDDQMTAEAIAAQLNGLEQTARVKGAALGSGFAYPVTVEVAARWADSLKARGLQLAPASAIAHR